MNVYSGSAIPAFRHHVTIFSNCPVTIPCNSLAKADCQLVPLFTHRPSGDLFLLVPSDDTYIASFLIIKYICGKICISPQYFIITSYSVCVCLFKVLN
jgi:hypothetical protein